MALQLGIVGLPNVGKSTLLNALTHAHAEASNYPFCTIDRNVGAAAIDDPRLRRLAELLEPKETIPASIQFVDIAGLVRGASRGEGLGNQFLGHIRDVDALVHVVRCFEAEQIAHVDGSVDPIRDFEIVETELMLADLQAVERNRAKLQQAAKGNPRLSEADLALLDRLADHLRGARPLRLLAFSEEEDRAARELCLLSRKPVVVVANVAEDDPEGRSDRVASLRRRLPGLPILPLAVSLEAELADLTGEEREVFLRDLDLPASGLDRLLELSRGLLRLVTFYTTAHEKLQSWLVPEGTKAPRAAGRIHSQMETGFIRVEVIRPDDLEEFRSRAELLKHGRVHTEGKDYTIREGDICHFLFQPG